MRQDMTKSSVFRFVAAVAAVSAIASCGPALAGTASSAFAVSANVQSSCSVSASALAFGTYIASSATANDATSNVVVTCTNGLNYTVALDGGTNMAAVNGRAMTDGASHNLPYALYTATNRMTLWGDGTLSTSTVPGIGNGAAQTLTVFGRIPMAQFVNAGSYTDSVNVTVSY
jgi:spore coat protein U-like protein